MTVFDSTIYSGLFGDVEIAGMFNDEAEIDAMIRVEAALAGAQGEYGVIPEQTALTIQKSLNRIKIDPSTLSSATKRDGVPVPALVGALREQMDSPEHAQYLHWGATSQDIVDTGLVLRLKQVSDVIEIRISSLLVALAELAETHAEQPMAARTRAQIATVTSFGAVIAAWGSPMLNHLEVLAQIKPRLLRVSLAGASGNASMMTKVTEVRKAMARELGLGDSTICWHSERSSLVEFTSLLTRISGSLAKMAGDIILAGQTEIDELKLKGGGSSTMPQKNNPVVPETIVSLFQFSTAMNGLMNQSLLHRQQRDGTAWMQEWMALPQICESTGKSLALSIEMISTIQIDSTAMEKQIFQNNGLIFAEVISFKLAEIMPRSEAQAEAKYLCEKAVSQDCSLLDLVTGAYPQLDWEPVFKAENQLGDVLSQVKEFVDRVAQIN